MKDADSNGDGAIEFEEFNSIMEKFFQQSFKNIYQLYFVTELIILLLKNFQILYYSKDFNI